MSRFNFTRHVTVSMLAVFLLLGTSGCSSRGDGRNGGPVYTEDSGDYYDAASDVDLDEQDTAGPGDLDANPNNNQDTAGPNEQDTNNNNNKDVATDTDTPDDPIPHRGVITTKTAVYSGALKANQTIVFDFQSSKDDTIVMWLYRANAEQWHPAISIEKTNGSGAIVYNDPKKNADVHIPYREEDIDNGFTFNANGPYNLFLKNRSAFDGNYVLAIQCLAGPCNGVPTGPPEMPRVITTKTATYAGVLDPSAVESFEIQAEDGDTVVMTLQRVNGEHWFPAISLHRDGTTIIFSDPNDDLDAHIPYKVEDLATGFAFNLTRTYDLLLKNRSLTKGNFIFSVECLSGPCNGDVVEPGDLSYPNFGTLQNATLTAAIRANHDMKHSSLGYFSARTEMFGSIDNKSGTVECIYTGTKITTDGIPDHTVMNTEHTWPQSRGASYEPQRSDLHHLFPSMSFPNAKRSNYEFGKVVSVIWSEGGSKLGTGTDGQIRFEPRDVSKGNIARAIMYFSVIYNLPINSVEEATLRQWHVADPVNNQDRARNNDIEAVQGSRNPFIDNPGLVSRIADF